MKSLKNLFFATLSFVAFAGIFTSCNMSSNSGESNDNTIYTFATVEAVNDNGASFTFRKEDDSPLITLYSTQSFNTTTVKAGMRVFIGYTITGNQPYTSGQVTITGMLSPLGGDIIVGTADDYEQFASQKIGIEAFWRSGEYLNITATGAYYQDPKTFALVVDETTIDEPYPTAYLIFKSDRDIESVSDKAIYGSFDISEVWNREGFKGLAVHVNSTGVQQLYSFNKGAQTITPVE